MKICEKVKQEQNNILNAPIVKIPDTIVDIFKSGGNLKIKSKSGNKIHIKKENRGKFTDYCGGSVTSECIARGKRSSNPAIRKRATFAANARKWKHQMGGSLNYIEWEQMTPEQKQTYRTNRAKANLNSGNLWEALMSYVGSRDPENPNVNQMIVDVPLPGKVNMSLYKNAKTVLKGAQQDEGFVNFVDRLVSGKVNPQDIGVRKTPNFEIVDLHSETIPKGMIQGKSAPIVRYPMSEEGLTMRTVRPMRLENPITTEEEAAAARDYLKEIEAASKKKVGRPAGSKNKPKQPKEEVTKIDNNRQAQVTATERYHDKRTYSKKQRTADKYARAMESEDARPINAGQSVTRNRAFETDWKDLGKYKEYKPDSIRIERSLAKYDKGSYGYKQALARKKQLVERYRREKKFLKGGTLNGLGRFIFQ